MGTLGEILKVLSAASLGLSAGVMLTGAVVMVPFWSALEPRQFLTWFGENAQSMWLLAGPLQVSSLVLTTGAASVARWLRSPGRTPAVGAAVFSLGVLVPYFLYFQTANASFGAATIEVRDVPAELARWAFWQWVRIGLGLAAFVFSLLALRRAESSL